MFGDVLVPLDGSAEAERALDIAIPIARYLDSTLRVVSYVDAEFVEQTLDDITAAVAAHDIEGLTNGNRVGPLRQLAQRRHEVPLDDVDRAVGVLGRVSGPRHGHALAPPMDAIGAHCLDEHEIAHALGAEARPEGPHEGDVESVEAQ